jgi:hypothetical protein
MKLDGRNSKKSFKYFIFTYLLIGLLVTTSCRKLVQSEFPYFLPKPVVNSILIADSLIKVHVSMASKLDSNELQGISNAQVFLYVNDSFKEQLTYADSGIYLSSVIAVPLSKYECKVIVPGYDTASASCTLPARARVFNPEYIAVVGKDQEGTSYPGIKLSFSNNPDYPQYYEIRIYNPESMNYSIEKWAEQNDPVLLNEGLPGTIFSNEKINDTAYRMKVNIYAYADYFASCFVEMRSISFEYYQFTRQKYLYDQGRFPEFGLGSYQGYQLYSNVKNGYGIFAGYSAVHSDTITISK